MATALDALANLTSNVQNPQSTVQGYLARRTRLDELKRNLSLRGPGFDTGATPQDVTQLEEDVNNDPEMGLGEQNRIKGVQEQNANDVRYRSPEATTQRKDALAEMLTKAEAPAKAQATGALAVEQEKNRGLNDILNNKQEFQQNIMDQYRQSGGTGSNGMIPTMGPNGVTFKQAIVPQTVQAERHSAEVGLQMLPNLRSRIDDLVAKGAMGGGMLGQLKQRAGSAMVSSGTDPLADTFGLLPAGAREFNDFKALLTLTKSNLGKVHFGNRASAAIGLKFDELLNPNQSPDALRGGLDATEAWLRKYANVSPEEQDAGAAELGIK